MNIAAAIGLTGVGLYLISENGSSPITNKHTHYDNSYLKLRKKQWEKSEKNLTTRVPDVIENYNPANQKWNDNFWVHNQTLKKHEKIPRSSTLHHPAEQLGSTAHFESVSSVKSFHDNRVSQIKQSLRIQ